MSNPHLKRLNRWHEALINQPIRVKMAGAFATIFLLIALSAGLVFWSVLDGVVDLTEFQSNEIVLLQLANDLRYYDAVLTDAFRSYIVNPQDTAAYDRYLAFTERYDAALAQARSIAHDPQDLDIFAQIDAISAEITTLEKSLLAAPNIDQFNVTYIGRYQELKDALAAQLDSFFTVHSLHMQEQQAHIVEHLISSLIVIVAAVGALFAVCLVIAVSLSRYIVRSLDDMIQVSQQYTKGNFEVRVPVRSRDELGALAETLNKAASNEQRYIKELEAARRQAEDATRMKDLFLATMSHELRTPLNAIIGFLHLMIYSDQLDEDNTYMAERSLANTQRLLTLINNILDLSRIATGGLQIVPTAIQIRYVVAGLYNDLKMMAYEKGLRLSLEVDPMLPETVQHDETRIAQIITNLVGNAIKFTEKGEVSLKVQRADDMLRIEVRDTGIGIPKSKLGLIFDDFFQVDASSTRQQQGAGLGLAIVKRIVLLMNGKIHVDSEVGVGTTFVVELPLELPTLQTQDKPAPEHQVFAESIAQARLVPSLG